MRLEGYDYSQNGAYFITICTQNREYLFGEIINGENKLNDAGKMIGVEWQALLNRFNNIKLDEYVIMPNHFHGIIIINNETVAGIVKTVGAGAHVVEMVGAPLVGAQPHILGAPNRATTRVAPTGVRNVRTIIGDIVGAFKSTTTHKYIVGVKNNDWQSFDGKLWQRNYYEHIIRNEKSLDKIREYIIDNPQNWNQDELFI